jgi:hypothetical protein
LKIFQVREFLSRLLNNSSVPKKAGSRRSLFAQKWPNLGFIVKPTFIELSKYFHWYVNKFLVKIVETEALKLLLKQFLNRLKKIFIKIVGNYFKKVCFPGKVVQSENAWICHYKTLKFKQKLQKDVADRLFYRIKQFYLPFTPF